MTFVAISSCFAISVLLSVLVRISLSLVLAAISERRKNLSETVCRLLLAEIDNEFAFQLSSSDDKRILWTYWRGCEDGPNQILWVFWH